MRITNLMMVNNTIQNMADGQEKISKLRERVATQKQFQTASEDPVHASASLSLRSNLRTLEAYADTAAGTSNWMNATDYALNQLEEIGVQASNIILRGLNDSLSGSERYTALRTEMLGLIDKAVEIGNTNVNGQFIFSGYQVNQKAFDLTDYVAANPVNELPYVNYQGIPFTPKVLNYRGDTGIMQRTLGPDQTVPMNVRGDQAIQQFIEDLIVASNALTQNNIHDPATAPAYVAPYNAPPYNTGPYFAPATLPTLQEALTKVKSSADIVNQYRTSNGARMRQVDSAANFLETIKIETKNLLSQKEDTNMAEGIALLTNQQTTFQAVLEVSQRAISALTLFDYMQ
jgi:flagellar hook-associated protein 3 FlgL